MKKDEIIEGQPVIDRWYPEKGTGIIKKVMKTRIKIQFKEVETWDYSHAKQFLEVPSKNLGR